VKGLWANTFRFDVLAQLANIPARITLYEFLRLFKSTRDALREVLGDSEVFLTQISAIPEEEDDGHCHQASRCSPYITFSSENMQLKKKHNRLLYYTGYIRLSEVSRIQVNPGSALSIMPCRVMQHVGIPTHRLSAIQTIIYGFNANGMRPMGKIKLRCQIADLKFEVMYYVIDEIT